jgi:hypothetical protein
MLLRLLSTLPCTAIVIRVFILDLYPLKAASTKKCPLSLLILTTIKYVFLFVAIKALFSSNSHTNLIGNLWIVYIDS